MSSFSNGWENRKLINGVVAQFIVPMRDKPPTWSGEIPWCRIEDFEGKYLFDSKSDQCVDKTTVESMNLKIIPVGTVLCSCSATLGVCTIVGRELVTNQTFIGLVPEKDVDAEFLYYKMSSLSNVLQGMSSGTTIAYLPREKFENFYIDIPLFPTQKRISEILSTIDETIGHTETLIKKYQKIKAGLMHDLFTRGVTSDGKLRPTCNQAPQLYKESPLGWIPKEWNVLPLKEITGKIADRDHTTPEYVEDGILMVSPTNLIDDEKIDFDSCQRISLKAHNINSRKTDIRSGDLILHRIGAGLGAVRLITDDMPEFSILHSMALVRPLSNIVDENYLLWAFRTVYVQRQIELGIQSIGVPDLGLNKIGNFLFPIAPQYEQKIITRYLESQSSVCADENLYLSKLIQLKHGLMNDLLTGRVPVKVPEPVSA